MIIITIIIIIKESRFLAQLSNDKIPVWHLDDILYPTLWQKRNLLSPFIFKFYFLLAAFPFSPRLENNCCKIPVIKLIFIMTLLSHKLIDNGTYIQTNIQSYHASFSLKFRSPLRDLQPQKIFRQKDEQTLKSFIAMKLTMIRKIKKDLSNNCKRKY